MSVNLENVNYLSEERKGPFLTGRDTIASFGNLYVAIDILRLIAGEVDIPKITLADGFVRLVKLPDSTLNIIHTLGLVKENELESPETADSLKETVSPEFLLDAIYLKDVQINYVDSESTDTLNLAIREMNASLDYSEGYISTVLDMDSEFRDLKLLHDPMIKTLNVKLKTSLLIDDNQGVITLKPSQLQIQNAHFNLSGTVDYSDDEYLDLDFKAKDEDLSFFKLFLTETGLENLKSGETFLSGTVKGPFLVQLPEIKLDFGMRNVSLDVPGVEQGITDLNLQGSFQSGRKIDLSDAVIHVEKCTGNLPGGYVNAMLSVENFTVPRFILELDLETELTGYDEVFSISGVEDLSGDMKLHAKYAGVYDLNADTLIGETIESIVELDSVSFEIPDFIGIQSLSGKTIQSGDSVIIQGLSFKAGNSDFLINGRIDHLISMLTNDNIEVSSALMLKSDTFDLPDFFAYDPKVGRNFPYRIVGIDAEIKAVTTGEKLLEFESNPEINFEIEHLSATIETLFPKVFIKNGNMLMTEQGGRIYLAFDDFDMEVANGAIHTDVIYHSPRQDPDLVKVEAVVSGLNVAEMIFDPLDSIPGIARGILDGDFKTEIAIGLDTMDFDTLFLAIKVLNYTTVKDTIDIAGLDFSAWDVYYQAGPNPLATITANIDFKAQQVKSNHFSVQDVYYNIEAKEGEFTVVPEKIQFFGKEGVGVYILAPFDNPPRYELKYKVSEFRVEDFLANLMADTLLTGKMDFDLDVVLLDSSKTNMLSGTNGYVRMRGKDMTIYGIDLDNFISKYQRSQKFNLVDLGAVALAGPFGLAVTKGSEFAVLAIGEFGEKTKVQELNSEWVCKNGRFILEDVAFTTIENLVACQGWVDLSSDSLNVTVAVLDKNRCSIVSQSIYGHLNDPQYGEVNMVSTVLAPITNLIDGALGRDCEVFYDGKLLHPLKKKKQ